MRESDAIKISCLQTDLGSSGQIQHAWQMVSLAFHLGFLYLLWAQQSLPMPQASGGATTPRVLAWIYVPPKVTEKRNTRSAVSGLTRSESRPSGLKLELTGIRLVIQDDPNFYLLQVLQRKQGLLGFATLERPEYVTNLFQPPDWRPLTSGSWVPVSNFFAVRIMEPGKWPLVVSLRKRFQIPADTFVYALFPPEFQQEIGAAIREEAVRKYIRGHVTEAVIAFSAQTFPGVRVETVTGESGQ